jgi:translation initiation factor 3 subunit J
VVAGDPSKPGETIDLSKLALFSPVTKDQFSRLRETLVPLMTANAKKAQYVLFLEQFTKAIVKDLPSEQIRKISSGLTTLGNEKMKEEKILEKGGKKSKAAKTKTTLAAGRNISTKADTTSYADEGFDE